MKSLWSVLRPRLSWGQMVFCIKHSHFLSPMTVLASKLEVPTNLVLISLFFVPVAWASKSLNWNCFVVPSYPACLSESASLLWNPWLAEFLIWKVKPRPGNHFCFFGLALPQIGRWGKTSAVAISQPPPCHNQFQGRLLLMPSLHLMSSRGRFAAACQQPVWAAAPQLHSAAGTLSFLSRRGPAPDWWTKCAAAHAGKVTRRLFWPVLQWSYTLSMLQLLLHPVFTIYLFLLNLLFLPLSSQSFPPPIFQTHRSPCCSASTDVKPFTGNQIALVRDVTVWANVFFFHFKDLLLLTIWIWTLKSNLQMLLQLQVEGRSNLQRRPIKRRCQKPIKTLHLSSHDWQSVSKLNLEPGLTFNQ